MSLDLLAVFFGGATALLPIFAADILHIGATGLGWLRAAPAVGAGLTAMWIAHRPAFRNAGMVLLASVAAFGAATIGFAISTSAWLSFAMLFLTGVFDSVSVVLRISLVQSRDAGCAARASIGGERIVYRRVQSMGRGGIGHGGGLDGHGACRWSSVEPRPSLWWFWSDGCRPACAAGKSLDLLGQLVAILVPVLDQLFHRHASYAPGCIDRREKSRVLAELRSAPDCGPRSLREPADRSRWRCAEPARDSDPRGRPSPETRATAGCRCLPFRW